MNIYFCGAIAGGRDHLPTYVKIVEHLRSRGHKVLTDHIVLPNVLDLEDHLTAEEIYERDMAWLRSADVVIAEVSQPSLGVGYEIASALQIGKPVLALYGKALRISAMIKGNRHPLLTLHPYDGADLYTAVDRFLDSESAHATELKQRLRHEEKAP